MNRVRNFFLGSGGVIFGIFISLQVILVINTLHYPKNQIEAVTTLLGIAILCITTAIFAFCATNVWKQKIKENVLKEAHEKGLHQNRKELTEYLNRQSLILNQSFSDSMPSFEISESLEWDETLNYSHFTKLGPSLLTTLGVLGTFIGIVGGLVQTDFSSVEKSQTSINHLLNGAGTAFVASIWGVLLAIFLYILKGLVQSQYEVAHRKLFRHLNAQDIDSPQKVLSDMRTLLESLSDDIATNMKPSFDALNSSIKDLGGGSAEMVDSVLQGALSRFNGIMGEQVGSYFQELRKTIDTFMDWHRQTQEELHRISETIRETTDVTREMGKELQTYTIFSKEMSIKFAEAGNQMHQTVEKLAQQNRELFTFAEKTSANIEKLGIDLSHQIGQTESISKNFVSMFGQQEKTLKELSVSFHTIATSAGQEFQNGLKGSLSQVDKALGDSVDRFRSVLMENKNVLDRVERNVNQLGKLYQQNPEVNQEKLTKSESIPATNLSA